MTIGSLPVLIAMSFWGYLSSGAPTALQLETSMIAVIFSGILGGVLSYKAMQMTGQNQLALLAVESTQIFGVLFTLQHLYTIPSGWEKFGRLIAELFFNYSQSRTEEFLFNTPEERYIKMMNEHPEIVNRIAAYHISSYLGIKNPSMTRIKKRVLKHKLFGL